MANLDDDHDAVEYREAYRSQIGLRAQYIRILREEYSMTHLNNAPPPLHFDANVTEEDIERAKKMYESAIKSMLLPRSITQEYLSELHYDGRTQLYDDWVATWDQQLGHLGAYQRYRCLQRAMKRGSSAKTAMENAMRLPEFAALPTQEKYQRCLSAIAATSSKQIGVMNLKKIFEKRQQPAKENEKDWYIQKVNEYDVLHRADETYIKSIQERVAIYIRSLRDTTFKTKLTAAAVTFTYDDDTTMDSFGVLIDTIVTNTKVLNLSDSPLLDGGGDNVDVVSKQCDYCNNSKDETRKANANKCPGRYNVEYVKGQVRNVNCPILQMNRERKKED